MSLWIMSPGAISLTANTAKSVLELGTSGSVTAKIRELHVLIDGTDPTIPPTKIEIGRFSAAVTTASTFNAGSGYPVDATSGSSATTPKYATTSEGAGTFGAGWTIGYQMTQTEWVMTWDTNTAMKIAISSFWRMRLTTDSTAGTRNCYVTVVWEE